MDRVPILSVENTAASTSAMLPLFRKGLSYKLLLVTILISYTLLTSYDTDMVTINTFNTISLHVIEFVR